MRNVGFFYGAMLADPAGLLEGDGKRMRHVKLRPGKELDVEALSDLIEAAYHDIRRRSHGAGADMRKATTTMKKTRAVRRKQKEETLPRS